LAVSGLTERFGAETFELDSRFRGCS
jgi:hypothetical protein